MDIYEQRPFIGGKVASFKDKNDNHIEMGLHVFFGCGSSMRSQGLRPAIRKPCSIGTHTRVRGQMHQVA